MRRRRAGGAEGDGGPTAARARRVNTPRFARAHGCKRERQSRRRRERAHARRARLLVVSLCLARPSARSPLRRSAVTMVRDVAAGVPVPEAGDDEAFEYALDSTGLWADDGCPVGKLWEGYPGELDDSIKRRAWGRLHAMEALALARVPGARAGDEATAGQQQCGDERKHATKGKGKGAAAPLAKQEPPQPVEDRAAFGAFADAVAGSVVVIAPRSWQDATLGLRGPNGATGEGYGDRIDSLKRRVLSYIGRARGSGQLQSELPKAFGMGATTFFFHLRVLAARQLVHYEPNQAATSENDRAVMTSRWRLMRFVPPELRDAPVAESMILQNMRQIVAHLQALGGMGVASHIAHVMGMSHAGEMEHKQRRHYMKRFREIKKKLEGAGVVEAFMADKAMAVGGSDQPGAGGDGDAEGNGESKADTAKKTVLVSCMKLVEPFDEAKLLEAAGVETDDVKDMSACEAGTVPKSFAEISMIEQMMYIIERTGAEGKLQTEIFTDLGISAKKYMGTLEKLSKCGLVRTESQRMGKSVHCRYFAVTPGTGGAGPVLGPAMAAAGVQPGGALAPGGPAAAAPSAATRSPALAAGTPSATDAGGAATPRAEAPKSALDTAPAAGRPPKRTSTEAIQREAVMLHELESLPVGKRFKHKSSWREELVKANVGGLFVGERKHFENKTYMRVLESLKEKGKIVVRSFDAVAATGWVRQVEYVIHSGDAKGGDAEQEAVRRAIIADNVAVTKRLSEQRKRLLHEMRQKRMAKVQTLKSPLAQPAGFTPQPARVYMGAEKLRANGIAHGQLFLRSKMLHLYLIKLKKGPKAGSARIDLVVDSLDMPLNLFMFTIGPQRDLGNYQEMRSTPLRELPREVQEQICVKADVALESRARNTLSRLRECMLVLDDVDLRDEDGVLIGGSALATAAQLPKLRAKADLAGPQSARDAGSGNGDGQQSQMERYDVSTEEGALKYWSALRLLIDRVHELRARGESVELPEPFNSFAAEKRSWGVDLLDMELRDRILDRIKAGETVAPIAEQLGVSRDVVLGLTREHKYYQSLTQKRLGTLKRKSALSLPGAAKRSAGKRRAVAGGGGVGGEAKKAAKKARKADKGAEASSKGRKTDASPGGAKDKAARRGDKGKGAKSTAPRPSKAPKPKPPPSARIFELKMPAPAPTVNADKPAGAREDRHVWIYGDDERLLTSLVAAIAGFRCDALEKPDADASSPKYGPLTFLDDDNLKLAKGRTRYGINWQRLEGLPVDTDRAQRRAKDLWKAMDSSIGKALRAALDATVEIIQEVRAKARAEDGGVNVWALGHEPVVRMRADAATQGPKDKAAHGHVLACLNLWREKRGRSLDRQQKRGAKRGVASGSGAPKKRGAGHIAGGPGPAPKRSKTSATPSSSKGGSKGAGGKKKDTKSTRLRPSSFGLDECEPGLLDVVARVLAAIDERISGRDTKKEAKLRDVLRGAGLSLDEDAPRAALSVLLREKLIKVYEDEVELTPKFHAGATPTALSRGLLDASAQALGGLSTDTTAVGEGVALHAVAALCEGRAKAACANPATDLADPEAAQKDAGPVDGDMGIDVTLGAPPPLADEITALGAATGGGDHHPFSMRNDSAMVEYEEASPSAPGREEASQSAPEREVRGGEQRAGTGGAAARPWTSVGGECMVGRAAALAHRLAGLATSCPGIERDTLRLRMPTVVSRPALDELLAAAVEVGILEARAIDRAGPSKIFADEAHAAVDGKRPPTMHYFAGPNASDGRVDKALGAAVAKAARLGVGGV